MKGFGGRTGLLVGVCLGAVAAPRWRLIVKEGVKVALRANTKVREVSARAVEELSDVAEEARWEAAHRPGPVAAPAPAPQRGDGTGERSGRTNLRDAAGARREA